MSQTQRDELERTIVAHLEAGDLSQAAAAMVRGYGSEVMSYLVGVCRDPGLADEVFSATTEDLWRGLPSFRGQSSARTWLYRLAYHALQRQRRDPYRRRQQTLSQELNHAADYVRSQTAPFLRTEVKDAVSQLREQLTQEEQTLLILRVDRELPWRDVAGIMAEGGDELSDAVLAKRFQRVREKLRRLANDAGLLGG